MGLPHTQSLKMEASLRKAGIRITAQRIAILAVLSETSDHPDAEELLRRTKEIEPSVSLATVYRNLSVLEQAGVIQRHAFDGSGARFETTWQDHHDHIVDIDTGHVIEFSSDEIEQRQAEIADKLGYELVHHRLELYCRKK